MMRNDLGLVAAAVDQHQEALTQFLSRAAESAVSDAHGNLGNELGPLRAGSPRRSTVFSAEPWPSSPKFHRSTIHMAIALVKSDRLADAALNCIGCWFAEPGFAPAKSRIARL